jgi:hypothetical protein
MEVMNTPAGVQNPPRTQAARTPIPDMAPSRNLRSSKRPVAVPSPAPLQQGLQGGRPTAKTIPKKAPHATARKGKQTVKPASHRHRLTRSELPADAGGLQVRFSFIFFIMLTAY